MALAERVETTSEENLLIRTYPREGGGKGKSRMKTNCSPEECGKTDQYYFTSLQKVRNAVNRRRALYGSTVRRTDRPPFGAWQSSSQDSNSGTSGSSASGWDTTRLVSAPFLLHNSDSNRADNTEGSTFSR